MYRSSELFSHNKSSHLQYNQRPRANHFSSDNTPAAWLYILYTYLLKFHQKHYYFQTRSNKFAHP